MDGHPNQGWPQNDYGPGQPHNFYDQLQQHAMNQQRPSQYYQHQQDNGYQQQQYHTNLPPQQRATSRVEVVIPSRPTQYHNYQQPQPQPVYQYSQQYTPQPPPNQQVYQNYQHVSQLDGSTDGFQATPVQTTPHTPLQPVQNGVSKHVPHPNYSKTATPRPVAAPQVDYAQTLLTLAEEYIAAAEKVERDSEEEFRLLSFALGCLESTLKNYQLPPLKGAQASLVYARLLYEHTENHDEAEKQVTKAIEVCDRHKFIDLKYSLCLLSVRFLYDIKPKAAMKALSSHIEEMEAYRHTAWLYIYYYESAILYLEPATRDIHQAIDRLEKLENLATRYHDKAIVAFAATTLALVHLQTSHIEAVSSAQQAIARLRALQFDQEVASIPQLSIMSELVDLCCSIRTCNFVEGDTKRVRVQDLWGQIAESPVWADKGALFLPLSDSSLRDLPIQKGGLIVKRDGRHFLPFSWFTRADAEALCFLLCTVSKAPKNSSDGFKAEQFCKAGIERVLNAEKDSTHGPASARRRLLECRFYVEWTFLCCMKGDWSHATNHLAKALQILKDNSTTFPKSIFAACQYLKGSIYQGTGQLTKAMECWKKPVLDPLKHLRAIDPNANPPKLAVIRSQDLETEILHNLSILALINRLFIIDDPSHSEHASKESLLTLLNTFISHPPQDRNITTSCTLAHSLLTNSGIWVSKDRLIKALNESKQISNQQLTALILALMQQAFFLGATDQHAQQCVKAASVQVRSWRNPTWMHVMDGIWAESLGYLGEFEEMEGRLSAAKGSWEGLPEGVRRGVDWSVQPVRKSVAKK